jgi:hypothetical protein
MDLIHDLAWLLFIPMGALLFFMVVGVVMFAICVFFDPKGWPPRGSKYHSLHLAHGTEIP